MSINDQVIRILVLGAAIAGLGACEVRQDDVYVGYIEAEYVYVAAPEAGWLVEAPLAEGDVVREGDTLFTLDNERQRALYDMAAAQLEEAGARAANIETGARPEEIARLEAQFSEAKATLELARRERDRWMPLVDEGNASRARGDQVTADYEAAEARVKAAEDAIKVARLGGRDAERDAAGAARTAAEAGLAEAAWRLRERVVTARRSGRIEEVFHREGEMVGAGAPVLAVLPEDGLKARFFVPQDALTGFQVGANVQLRIDGRAETVPARITHIASEAEFTPPVIYSAESREKLVFLIEAKPTDTAVSASLRPGLPVDVVAP
ncbi:MAG: HlyD family efflux transporter periplasmic adaptor subunit [Pseudomonadota bacterium]